MAACECDRDYADSAERSFVLDCAQFSTFLLQVGYIDDRFGPLGLAAVVVLALTAILIISIVDFAEQLHAEKGGSPPPWPAGPPLQAPLWMPAPRSSLRGMALQGAQAS